jgi:hypothetical protein
MTQPEDLQELCRLAREWVASSDGQRIIQESLSDTMAVIQEINKSTKHHDTDWQCEPFRQCLEKRSRSITQEESFFVRNMILSKGLPEFIKF